MDPEPPIQVMIVDDHALIRSAIRQALEGPDVVIVGEAGSAEEALELAPQLRPDVLLIGHRPPRAQRHRGVRELAPRLPETQIVMPPHRPTTATCSKRFAMGDRLPHEGLAGRRCCVRFGLRRGDLQCLAATPRRWSSTSRAARARVHRVRRDRRDAQLARAGRAATVAEGLTDREIAAGLAISPARSRAT